MPAATTKAELLAVTEKEFDKLAATMAKVSDPLASTADTDGDSILSVVAHRAHWIDLFLGWWRDGQAGSKVYMPAKGYKWSDLKRYNADLRARQAGMTWDEAHTALGEKHAVLVAFINDLDEAELYGGPMKGARNHWTTGRYAEAAGPSHYRSANKYVRARLRASLA